MSNIRSLLEDFRLTTAEIVLLSSRSPLRFAVFSFGKNMTFPQSFQN